MPVRRALIPAIAALAFAGGACAAAAQSSWRELPAIEARRTGVFEHPDLDESSGVAVSRRRPGVLWSLNDSGNSATLYATDTLGRHLGAVAVGAENVDWEALAAGPCGPAACLYIADTGDNREHRESVMLYRLAEPAGTGARERSARVESLRVRYREGPHDVEAMFVDDAGAVHLVSKGRSGAVRHWLVDAAAWRAGSAVLESRGALPVPVEASRGRLVTGAALSPDGATVAVRTYSEIFFFRLAQDGHLAPEEGALACGLGALELQGEGVDWLDAGRLVLTAEGVFMRSGTVSVVRCPRG